MSNIVPFDFEGSNIRGGLVGGEPLFAGSDVAAVLGYADPDKAIRTHCKAMKKLNSAELAGLGLTNPPAFGMTMIPERDVYRLIMRSKLPAAERFEEWVVGTVLPAIRKTGGYTAPTVELSAENRAVIGGIVKAVMTKATALVDEKIAAVDAKLAALKMEVHATLEGFDPSQSTIVGFLPMLDVVTDEGAGPKGRRCLVQRCSTLMRRWCVAQGRDKAVRISRESKRYLFQVDAVKEWLAAEGRAIIKAHKDKIAGQGVFKLVHKECQ